MLKIRAITQSGCSRANRYGRGEGKLDKNFKLGFIGVGNMGSAIVAGGVKNHTLPPQNIVSTGRDKRGAASLHEQFGVIMTDGIDELFDKKLDASLYAA